MFPHVSHVAPITQHGTSSHSQRTNARCVIRIALLPIVARTQAHVGKYQIEYLSALTTSELHQFVTTMNMSIAAQTQYANGRIYANRMMHALDKAAYVPKKNYLRVDVLGSIRVMAVRGATRLVANGVIAE